MVSSLKGTAMGKSDKECATVQTCLPPRCETNSGS